MAKRRKGKTATAPATADVAIGYGVAHEIVRILQRYGAQRFANSVDKGNAILAIAAIRIPVPVTDALETESESDAAGEAAPAE